MKRLCTCIFSILTFAALAQEGTKDSVIFDVPPPVIRPATYVDYGKLITYFTGLEEKLEGSASLLILDHYELIGELGKATLSPKESYTNANYSATGIYYRIGANFSKPFKNEYRIALGARYGVSNFSDKGRVEIASDTINNTYQRSFERPGLEARWWELVLTSDKKIQFNKEFPNAWYNNFLVVGFNVRMRFLVTYDRDSPVDVYSIPGYGKSIDASSPAINLFIKVFLF